MYHFKAPWGKSLIVISFFSAAICLAVVLWPFSLALNFRPDSVGLSVRILLLAVLMGSGLCVIRGYTVTSDSILIHRLFWTTRLPRTDLQSARFEPRAMRGSLRLF